MCTFVMLDKGDATGRCSCLWSKDGDNLSLQYFLLPVEIVGYSRVMLYECVLKVKKHMFLSMFIRLLKDVLLLL